jgi:hypothetical protein
MRPLMWPRNLYKGDVSTEIAGETKMKAGLKEEAQGGAQAQEKAEAEKKLCPRCGQPLSYIESYKKGSQTYYVAVHYEGYEKAEVEGRRRIKKKVRKCYLGPQVYKYVEKLHEL